MKRFAVALLVVGLSVSTLIAQDSSSDQCRHRIFADRPVAEVLEQPFSNDFSLPAKPTLRDALLQIRSQTAIAMFVDHIAMREIGVSIDSPVKFRLPCTMPLKDAVAYLLKQHNLAYVVKNELLFITTERKARGGLVAKTYYVGDLIMKSDDEAKQKDIDKAVANTALTPFIEYVQTMVAPESWGDENGAQITESYPNLSIVVRQTDIAHAEIVELLAKMRKTK